MNPDLLTSRSERCHGACWCFDLQERRVKTILGSGRATDIFAFEVIMAELFAWPRFPRQAGIEKLPPGGTLCHGRFLCFSVEQCAYKLYIFTHLSLTRGDTRGRGEGPALEGATLIGRWLLRVIALFRPLVFVIYGGTSPKKTLAYTGKIQSCSTKAEIYLKMLKFNT